MEMRYTQSFLRDLRKLQPANYQQIYDFVFVDFTKNLPLHSLPELRQLDSEGIFYRFTFKGYLIGIEIKGEIVKFLRVIAMPDV